VRAKVTAQKYFFNLPSNPVVCGSTYIKAKRRSQFGGGRGWHWWGGGIMLNILEKLEDFGSLNTKDEHLDNLDYLINIIKIINILNIFEKTPPFTMLPKGKTESEAG